MADGSTTNLSFTLPEVGASDDTWGTKLNANWSALDALFDATPALTHEYGGLEADVSAYSGLLKISDGATSQAVAGTDYQAASAGLGDISGLAATDGNVIVGDGTNWVAESGATARTSLGLGTGDSPTLAGLTTTGAVTLGGNTGVTGVLTVNGSTDSYLFLNKDASGSSNYLYGRTNGSARWGFILGDSTAESGSDAGSDFAVYSFTDGGSFNASPLTIKRSNSYVNLPGVYSETTGSSANVYVASDGSLRRSTSSLRYKINIEDMTYGLKDVLALRPVTYSPKPNGENEDSLGTRFGGLIAEEVDAAGLKEFVGYNDEGQPDSLHYGHMVALCVKAIQELKTEVDELRSKLDG